MIDSTDNRYKVKRGDELPQSKLCADDIRLIRLMVEERDKLKAQLAQLSNRKIAEKFEVHRRTIDRVTAFSTWTHL